MDDRDVAIELLAKDMASAAIRDVGRELGGLQGFARNAGDALRAVGGDLRRIGRDMTTKVTLPVLGAGAAIWAVASDFDTALRQVVGLTQVTAEEIGGIEDAILRLSGEVGRTPQELAEGFYFLASAGFNGNEALEVLESSAKAAASGLGETGDIAKVVGAAINAYGKENLDAAYATDVLLAGVGEGTAEATEFAGALGDVLGSAAQIGAEFPDVTAAIAAMTLKGIGANEAATSLNSIFVSLFKPTKEAAEAMKDVGISASGIRKQIKEEGLLATLQTLAEKIGGNEEAAAAMFGNVRALRGILALTNGDLDGTATLFGHVRDSAGSLNQAFEDTEGPQRDFDRAMADIQVTLIDLGATVLPLVSEVLGGLRDVLATFRDIWAGLSPEMQKGIVIFAGIAAAAGPVLILLGFLASGLGVLVTALGLLASPVAIIGAGLAFLAIKTGALQGILNVIAPVIDTVSRYLGSFAGAVGDLISGEGSLDRLAYIAQNFVDDFGEAVGNVGQTILDAIPDALAAIGTLAHSIFNWLLDNAPALLDQLLAWGKTLIVWITDRIPDAIEAIRGWAQAIFDWLINEGVPAAAAALGPMILAFVDWVFEVLPLLLDALDDIILAIVNFIVTNGPVLIGKLLEWGLAFVGWIATEVIPRLIENLPTILRTILLFLGGAAIKIVGKAGEIGLGLVTRFIGFAATLPGKVAGMLGNLLSRIIAALPGIIGKGAEMGSKFVGRVIEFIVTLPGKVAGFLGDVATRVAIWAIDMAAKGGKAAAGFVGKVAEIVLGLPGKIWGYLTGIVRQVGTWGGNLLSKAASAAGSFVRGFINGLASLPSKLYQAIRSAFAGLKIDIGPFHISGSGVTIDLPKIDLPSFDVGAWKLPSDMVATVHKGEMIIPADIAARLRGETAGSRGTAAQAPVSGGGGGTYVVIENHYGAGSVRSADDIAEISRQQAENVRLLGFRPSIRSSTGLG